MNWSWTSQDLSWFKSVPPTVKKPWRTVTGANAFKPFPFLVYHYNSSYKHWGTQNDRFHFVRTFCLSDSRMPCIYDLWSLFLSSRLHFHLWLSDSLPSPQRITTVVIWVIPRFPCSPLGRLLAARVAIFLPVLVSQSTGLSACQQAATQLCGLTWPAPAGIPCGCHQLLIKEIQNGSSKTSVSLTAQRPAAI